MKRILLLSGPMASGKSSISQFLQENHGFAAISSGTFLREQLVARSMPIDRHHLQELGDDLDAATDFSWIIESVARPSIDAQPHIDNWILDSVRKPRQIELFRLNYVESIRHVHVVAPESVLQRRYAERGVGLTQYQVNISHPNEQSARSLAIHADKVVDTDELILVEIANQILKTWER
ncbi:AAA family ATPase [Pseudomonas aeruginosa]|uniref:AAA family ATPase n=2 Tax=Pseudomonas aeruginosa TaxID=287 RepID=UPI0008FB2BE3|nr:AAA family ATPase [Pseudomonas aeruginosa]EIU1301262.1 AAA family ATPase [Pseudomonas aeruginosa]EIU1446229.1 AAA family ATPase [Pseudomonas aeruginosa]EIU1459067.1 AAA family ATPase [Pseudomonas aeruginosa]EIU2575448.1 AAA family ATPase [Pseudomonas aeruginosa]EIU2825683.1 AAA family ATPase [Pseudomonas aeruginosa]